MDCPERPYVNPSAKGRSFTKDERLLKPGDFGAAKKGRRLSTPSFTVYLRSNGLGARRLGLAVSSRVGNAVARNRIKRLLREFFRLNKDLFPESVDILVSVKGVERIEGIKDVEEELRKALRSTAAG